MAGAAARAVSRRKEARRVTRHRPPRLSWENLIRALTDARVPVSEENLIAPLTIELAPEVQAELDGPGT